MSPDQARDALASDGHDGLVRVEIQTEYDPDCGADRVCGFNVPESGMGIHDAIRLYVNRRRRSDGAMAALSRGEAARRGRARCSAAPGRGAR